MTKDEENTYTISVTDEQLSWLIWALNRSVDMAPNAFQRDGMLALTLDLTAVRQGRAGKK